MKTKMVIIIIWLMLLTVTIAKSQSDNSQALEKRFSEWSFPVNLGPPVNSPADDLSAVLLKDGLTLYFTSNRTGSAGEDIWVAKRRNKFSNWDEPVNLGAVVNSVSMDRLRSISADGRILLFQSNRTGGVGNNDIWVTTRINPNNDFAWGPPVNLGTVINTDKNEIAANHIFENQGRHDKMFFSSSRLGGIGDGDIYLSEIIGGGRFSQPVNLSELNSPYAESCLWVREDQLEMFFSSTRASLNTNVDSFDLWVSTRPTIFDRWSPPTSLGSNINVQGFRDVNPNLSADWQTMHFTSNRPGGWGGNDIYLTTRQRLRGNQ